VSDAGVVVHRYGDDALLVEVADHHAALALYRAAREAGAAVRDVVPAARSVLLDGVADLDAVERDLRTWEHAAAPAAGPVVEVPTVYDGPDLADVARAWEMTTAEVVATHTGLEHEVAFCGFSPGFAYCAGLPEHLAVRRRHDPRPRVPAGSVAVADRWTGVYPTASPGGWQLLGRTDLVLWDPERDPPATLAPGTRVRFVVA
jgi:KipI family sensor histidine kinase inhibitor